MTDRPDDAAPAIPDAPSDRTPIRIGLIGSGMMGFEHIRNFALQTDVEFVALADPEAASRDFGRKTAQGVLGRDVPAYPGHEDMLDRHALDAVVVASPNYTHAEVLDEILSRPLHVLVEKPLCTTLEDCDRMIEASARRDHVLWVGMEYRYMPPVGRLIEELQNGRAGRLRMLAIREHRFPFLEKVGNWNRFNRNTGGTMVEKCCHFFDLMNLIIGSRATRVFASGGQDVNHLDERYDGETPDILDNAFATIDYANGTRALLDLCMFAEASRNEQEICAVGDAGKLECFIPESLVVIGDRKTGRTEEIPIEVDPAILGAGFHHGATYYQHRAFLDSIRDPDAPRIDATAGRNAVALGLAAQRSIETGQPIDMKTFEGDSVR